VGALSSYWLWRFSRYWHRLFRQPYLQPSVLPVDLDDHPLVEARAQRIAETNLRSGIEQRRLPDGQEKLVICAGRRNFREPWARDLSFAAFGLVEMDEGQVVREALEVFLMHEREPGQFPVKVHSTGVIDRYLHSLFRREQPTVAPIRPKYITAHNTVSLDGNALLVIAALNYAERMDDGTFLERYWPALRRAVEWLEGHGWESDGLLHQGAFADWADSIARKGRVLYTNVVYWKALQEMAAAADRLGADEDAAYYAAQADRLGTALDEHFWREDLGYYVTSRDFDNLSSGGNLLAIAWGLATPLQAHAILDNMARFGMADPVPTKPVFPPYLNRFIALENRLGRIGYYHTSAAWLWLGAWHVIALSRVGRLEEAEELLHRISAVILRDGAVHEVYNPRGAYVSGLWYVSEAPFTWSAGMVVYAHHVYQRHLADRVPQEEAREMESAGGGERGRRKARETESARNGERKERVETRS
jgi:GH15 family glucan-1,4-alpha-glucosidase